MGKREVTILANAVTSVAEISYFIESKGLPLTAKKFVNDAFNFFAKLSNEKIIHKPCSYTKWNILGYRCVNYKKKYVIAYLANDDEIVICDFVSAKLLY
jgi:hypothetical protein